MQPHSTVLLVSSGHINWRGLHQTLQEQSDVRYASLVCNAHDAVHAATTLSPAIIIVPATLSGIPVVPLVRELHTVSHASKIIVLGDEKSLGYDSLAALGRLGSVSYLLWDDLSDAVLPLCLTIAGTTNLCVTSPAAMVVLAAPPRQPEVRDTITLTTQEQVVLENLAIGKTRGQIAHRLGLSERTVKRIISALEEQLDAPSPFLLGLRAAQHGVIA